MDHRPQTTSTERVGEALCILAGKLSGTAGRYSVRDAVGMLSVSVSARSSIPSTGDRQRRLMSQCRTDTATARAEEGRWARVDEGTRGGLARAMRSQVAADSLILGVLLRRYICEVAKVAEGVERVERVEGVEVVEWLKRERQTERSSLFSQPAPREIWSRG